MRLGETKWEVVDCSSGSGKVAVAECCEHDNEPPGSKKGGNLTT
jgi:hypothetical protein